MTYVIITPDGVVMTKSGRVTLDAVRDVVGVEGAGRIDLDREPGVVGWMNDCAYVSPARFPRNRVGSGVFATMGAIRRAYAGTLVLTGYDYDSDWGGPEDLGDRQMRYITAVSECVSAVSCGGPATPRPRADGPADWAPWAATMSDYLDFAIVCPDPLITYDEVLARGAR